MPRATAPQVGEGDGSGGSGHSNVRGQSFTGNLGDRRGSATRLPLDSQREVVRHADSGALHTCTLAPPAGTAVPAGQTGRMALPLPAAGVLAVYSDIGCPWATLAIHRLLRLRDAMGVDVRVEHRVFPLELVNRRATSRRMLDAEVAVIAGAVPDAGWRPWSGPLDAYPVTTLPAMEAVQAVAAGQGLEAAETLDLALRRAMFVESRCISLVPVILEVAQAADGVDGDLVEEALGDGRTRHLVRLAPEGVTGSPHVVRHDGRDAFNPGVTVEMTDAKVPVIRDLDDAALRDLLVGA